MSNLRGRLLRGGGATAMAQFVNALTQLLAVPLFLSSWGMELYGAWIVLSTMPAYFAMTDIGFGSAGANEMTMRAARNDRAGALRVFQSTIAFVTLVSLVLLVGAVLLVWTLPIQSLLKLDTLTPHAVSLTLTFLLLHVTVHMQGAIVAGAYRAVGLYAFSTVFGAVVKIVEFATVATLLVAGAAPPAVALAYFLVRLISMPIYFALLQRRHRWIRYGVGHASLRQIGHLSRPAIAFQGFPLGYALSVQGTVAVIGYALGPAPVVVFSTVRTLASSAKQALSVINATVWPELSRAYGAGEIDTARKLHRVACGLAIWVAMVGFVVLFFAGDHILEFWTGGRVNVETSFLFIMLLGIVGNAFWSTSLVVPSATNNHQRLAVVFVLASALSLALTVATLPILGLAGAASAVLMIDLVMSVAVMRVSLRLVHDRGPDFLRSQLAVTSLLYATGLGRAVKRPLGVHHP
jgi:O-antigen/teichoic acid export membrane protein